MPELPSKQAVDHLLHAYYTSAHTMTPIIHWPSFQQSVDELYRPGKLQTPQPSFVALFFSVLAVGSLFAAESHPHYRFSRASEFVEAARQLIDPWCNDFVLDHARTFVLITMFLNEMNLKSAAWVWLGKTVTVAQDIGLHTESGPWPVIEGEMRKRTWWTIYLMDRTMSIELGRPSLIDDADCDTTLPEGLDDHFIHDGGLLVPNGAEPLTHSLLAIIHVLRSYPAIAKALDMTVISPSRLGTIDQHFASCLRSFPPACDPSSSLSLPPHFLNPLLYLLNARIMLHRHNLSPVCPPDVRLMAVEQCRIASVETASYLARTSSIFPDAATALLVTHTFRCTLFLLLTGHFDHAATCVRALAAINTRRDVTIPCGRFIAFFVSTLGTKRAEIASYLSRTTPPGQQQPFGPPAPRTASASAIQEAVLRDEELIAYASADLQADSTMAWAWAGGEREPNGNAHLPSPVHTRGLSISTCNGSGPGNSRLFNAEARIGLNEEEIRDWGGWDRLQNLLHDLNSGKPSPGPAPAAAAQPWATPSSQPVNLKGEPGVPRGVTMGGSSSSLRDAAASSLSPTSAARNKNQDRISIANII
jgi:hypothetical protein